MTYLTSLRVLSGSLRSLQGLENLRRLETLDARGNEIADLTPLAKVTSLRSLFVGHYIGKGSNTFNSLEPLRNLHLTDLGIQWSQVVDVSPLAGHLGLRRLFLKETLITDLTPLAALTDLYIDHVSE